MAQLGARLDGIEEAVGSNPIGSTKILEVPFLCFPNRTPPFVWPMLTMMASSITLSIAETERYNFASYAV